MKTVIDYDGLIVEGTVCKVGGVYSDPSIKDGVKVYCYKQEHNGYVLSDVTEFIDDQIIDDMCQQVIEAYKDHLDDESDQRYMEEKEEY